MTFREIIQQALELNVNIDEEVVVYDRRTEIEVPVSDISVSQLEQNESSLIIILG